MQNGIWVIRHLMVGSVLLQSYARLKPLIELFNYGSTVTQIQRSV